MKIGGALPLFAETSILPPIDVNEISYRMIKYFSGKFYFVYPFCETNLVEAEAKTIDVEV